MYPFYYHFRLCKNNALIYGFEKVIASVFLKINGNLQIIALSTGNKGLRGDKIVNDGTALIDCHAEILARRGLLRFLYSEVLKFSTEPPNSIFTKGKNALVLKPGISFHLFINTAPCGVARIDVTFQVLIFVNSSFELFSEKAKTRNIR